MKEFSLLKSNLRNLFSNFRLRRSTYFISLVLIILTYYIGVPALVQNYVFEDPLSISKINVINVFVTSIIAFVLLVRRLMDMGSLKILWIYMIGGGIYGFFLKDSLIIFIRSMENFQLLSTNTFAFYWGYVLLSFLLIAVVPGEAGKNQYGEVPCVEKTDWGNIYFPQNSVTVRYKDFNTVSKKDFIKRIIDSFSLKPNRIKGRSKRRDLLLYYIGYQLIVLGYVAFVGVLNIVIGGGDSILHQIVFYISYYIFVGWIFITLLYLLVRRLHDSGRSGLWLFGLLIPYLNIYVFYLIFFKPSWEPSLIVENNF